MSIASEITRINNNIANAYTQISNKGGTLPQNQNSLNLANAIASITGGSSGLEYETGTYTPTTDITRPTISFANQHTTVPAIIVFTDTSGSSTLVSGTQLSFIFVSYSECVDTSVYEDSTETIGIVYYRYKGAQNYTGGPVILKPNGTGSNEMAYWSTNSAFFPSTYSQNRYWIADRTYKWIAVWK